MISWFRIAAAGATAIVVGGAGWWIYGSIKDAGYAECKAEVAENTAELQAKLDERAAALRERELEIERAEQVRATLERDLADEARDDPMADDPGLGLDSLRRLNQIK